MEVVNNLNLLESVMEQRAGFVAQREQMQINFQQLVGAIHACDVLIKQHEDALNDKSQDDCCPVNNADNINQCEEQVA